MGDPREAAFLDMLVSRLPPMPPTGYLSRVCGSLPPRALQRWWTTWGCHPTACCLWTTDRWGQALGVGGGQACTLATRNRMPMKASHCCMSKAASLRSSRR